MHKGSQVSNFRFEENRKAVTPRLNKHSFWVWNGVLALLAFFAVLITTRWGINLAPDSLVYIGSARSLLGGDGMRYIGDAGELAPVTHYPPLYPAMIALVGLTGMDPIGAARWVNAVLFAGNLVLVSVMVLAATASYNASLLTSVFLFVSFPMVQIHSVAWSEPPSIFFGFLGMFLMSRYLQERRRWMIYAASQSIALSCLARYAGVAFALAGAVGMFYFSSAGLKKRFTETIGFLTLSILPLVIWMLRNLWLGGTAAHRELGLYPVGVADLIAVLDSLCFWVFPGGIVEQPVWLRLLALGIVFVLLARFLRNDCFTSSRIDQLAATFFVVYGSFIILMRIFVDKAIPFESRILAPSLVAAVILVVSNMANVLKTRELQSRSLSRLMCCLLFGAVLVGQLTTVLVWWKQSYLHGIGYRNEGWRNSEIMNFVRDQPSSASVFANIPDLVYVLTGRLVFLIPRKADWKTQLPSERYYFEIANMREQLKKTNGAVVYFFDAENRGPFLPAEWELKRDAGLRLIERRRDGAIFQLNLPGSGF